MILTIKVRGKAVPQGTLVRNPAGGVYHAGGANGPLAQWRADIKAKAELLMDDRELKAVKDKPIAVRIMFETARPKKHYKTNGDLRADAPRWVATTPDIDKLARAVLDALTGTVFTDDKQVVSLFAQQVYADAAGVMVIVTDDDWRFD